MRILLTHQRSLKRKARDLENSLRHTLKAFGVKLHTVDRGGMVVAGEATAGDPLLAGFGKMNRRVRELAVGDEVYGHLMTVPAVIRLRWRSRIRSASTDREF